ncbi:MULTISPECIES: protein-export chaperone SecB [Janthinobacterium]|uniref:Protein-export chaperone SecB n=1 Tax=Janthinobacterium violaceinigrum TaxID=2654252 RepID=A0A6I1HZU7_9BURK|nr:MULTISPECIES: protein-export chaperone SecB [Janthinobacterium]KAB8063210.1 hypothetical protein GCN75_19780 [Janthinobacterium violaceinigrum]MED5617162.1 protein-export chaperone SecB [Janthinobacterium sp. P210005]
MEASKKKEYKLHAIQIIELRVAELSIKVNLEAPRDSELPEFTIETGRSNYDPETQQIQVRMRIVAGEGEDDVLSLKVELHGRFKVDETRFPIDQISHWADHNAPIVLYPYIREQVYSLTSKVGLPEGLLPLIEIPTFKVEAPVQVGN